VSEDVPFKPRIYIEVRLGKDWCGRSNNLWRGRSPLPDLYRSKPGDFYLGAVCLFSVEETLRSYRKKIERAYRHAQKAQRKDQS